MKLGLAVVLSLSVTLVAVVLGIKSGLRPRYTLPLGLLLSLAIVQVLARGMISPLREMAAAATAMSAGDYGRRVTASSRDEVGELAVAFNRMADDLAAVDAQRRQLVADVSHELRTPLTALQALLENLADGVATPDPATLESAVTQTRRLGRLVSQLLDLSRLEAGQLPLHREHIGLSQFVDVLLGEARSHTVDEVTLTASVEPPDLSVDADPERLHQVLTNLLDNAIRHSPPRGSVVVAAEPTGSGVRLCVTDQGSGITPTERERVFERFTRTDAARTAADGGSGLGLSITRWLVELHGGSVHVADTAPGCTLVVDLPRSAP
ncbi:MAG: histidine kinase [Frankiales bacterium]|nr:histidine kinase [Frankiales bacterium]